MNQRSAEKSLRKTIILSDILQSGILPKTLYHRVSDMMIENGIEKIIGIGHDISQNSDAFAIEKYFFPSTESFIQSGIWRKFDSEIILLKGAENIILSKLERLYKNAFRNCSRSRFGRRRT
jgi:alanine racemase